VIQGIVQRNLFRYGQFAATAVRTVQAEPAAVIRTPLTAGAVRTGMFFGSFIRHQRATLLLTILPSMSYVTKLIHSHCHADFPYELH
jgi:hypothetical protein